MTSPSWQINAADYGADPSNPDNSAALQAANDALGVAGGGVLFIPRGTLSYATPIVNTHPDVKWVGAGSGRFHYSGTYIVAATVLSWIGAPGATMLTMESTGAQVLSGCGVDGIFFDAGTGAAEALRIVSHCSGEFSVVGQGFTGQMVVLTTNPSLTESPADSQSNRFPKIIGNCATTGGLLTLDGAPNGPNASFNIVDYIEGNYSNGHALVLANCDNNLIDLVRLYRDAGGTGLGVAALGSNVFNSSSRSNVIRDLSTGTGGLYAQGIADVTYPAGDLYIEYLDAINGAFVNAGVGAKIWSGANNLSHTMDRLTGSVTYDPPSLGNGSGATTTISIPGATLGNMVQTSFSNALQGILLTGWVSATGIVSVRFQNQSGGTINLGNGVLTAWVTR